MTDAAEVAARLIEQAPDALIFADRAGVIREWNAAAERVFGYTAGEAIGERLDLIVPERFREAHWAGFDRAIAEGRTKYVGRSLPTRSARKDGAAIYVELSFAIVLGDGGEALGALALARNITKRFAHEREERARVQALEARLAALEHAQAPADQRPPAP